MSHREVIGKMCQQNCGRLIVKTDILLHTRDLIPELNLVLLIQEMHIAIIFTHCFIESQLSESLQDYNLSLIALSFKDKAQRFFDNGRRNRSFFDCSSTSYSKQGGSFWRIRYICTDKLQFSSNPQPIGFSGILLAKRQNSFYCTYFLHNRNVADTKSPYPIKRLEVIRWFNQKSMVFNQSLSWTGWHKHCCLSKYSIHAYVMS